MNLYATPHQVKQRLPSLGVSLSDTDLDDLMYVLLESTSRAIDKWTDRQFYPYTETRYFNGSGDTDQWVDDALSFTTVNISSGSTDSDGWIADSDFSSTDYLSFQGRNRNPRGSYNRLVMAPNGGYSTFPALDDTVWIDGVWAYTDDRSNAWVNSGDALVDALTSDAVTVEFGDVDGADHNGITPRFQVGQILKIGSEFLRITGVNSDCDDLSLVRGVNGSTAATATSDEVIYVWKPPYPIQEATVAFAVRQWKRAHAGFQDATANVELGEMLYVSALDAPSQALLDPYRKRWVVG